jgi:hypothetical protein
MPDLIRHGAAFEMDPGSALRYGRDDEKRMGSALPVTAAAYWRSFSASATSLAPSSPALALY